MNPVTGTAIDKEFKRDRFVNGASIKGYRIATLVLGLLFLTRLATNRLEGTPYAISLASFDAAIAGGGNVLRATSWAALKVWIFWIFSAGVLASVVARIDPEISLLDAILAGASGVWVTGYFLGQALGPIRLFRGATIWMLLIAGIISLRRHRPSIPQGSLTGGQILALLCFALLGVGLLPLQLASPVVPYMDVLSYPASVQRILTFGVYLPFDNDPYGCWGPRAQTPGLELFYALLAMGSHVRLAVLAESAAMMPMALLMIFATYRLGLTVFDDAAGGAAALLLFFTNTFRRMVGMRGTSVDYALIALGLAFFFDRSKRRSLTAMGAILLGTAVASHAINGGLAMALAACVSILIWIADKDTSCLKVRIVCLIGAGLIAFPEISIGTGKPLPFPILPLVQLAGLLLVILAARRMKHGVSEMAQPESPPRERKVNFALAAFFFGALVYRHAFVRNALFEQLMNQFPALIALAALGLVAVIALRDREISSARATIITTALLLGIAGEYAGQILGALPQGQVFQSAVADLGYKLDEYWCPYFLVFAAAIPFALLYRHGSKPVATFALLALLIYPWRQRPDANYDYEQHSIAENWAIDVGTAARGYWGGTPDSRWTVGPAEWALIDFMNTEIQQGRITASTHVLHVAHDVIVWREFNRFSVFTGINDDPVVSEIPASDIGWLAGGRVRSVSELGHAMASRPSYVLDQTRLWNADPPSGYEEAFHRDSLRLFRRRDTK
jgi:hypothetical protein